MQNPANLLKVNPYVLAIGFCCVLETLCFTYLQLYPQWGAFTAALYFISGLGVCVACFAFALSASVKPDCKPMVGATVNKTLKTLLTTAFFVFISVLLFEGGYRLFAAIPIDYRNADMLPLLRTACERWLHHEAVYKPVKEIWNGENIPYLPCMWLPFVPSVLWGIDMRWTTIVFTAASILIMLVIVLRLGRGYLFVAPVLFMSIFMVVKFYTFEEVSLFEFAEEPIPVFYFLVLFIALMYEWDWLTGVALALCTLSRFSLLPFLPFFFLWLLINGGVRHALKTGFIYALLMLIIFIIPFFVSQPRYFLNIPLNYSVNLEGYWGVNNNDLVGTRGLGLAYLFGYAHHQLMGIINDVLLILVPCLWLMSYWWLSKKYTIRKNIWAMAGLKLTLVVFYNFISMPYLYIFEVPTLITWPLLLIVAREVDL